MTERGAPLRFLASVNHGDGCTEWPFSRSCRGEYGQVRFDGRVRKAHQVAFILAYGREPSGLVRHTCDNPPCVNPAQLLEGTSAENMADARNRGRIPRGVQRPNGKGTPSTAEEIRSSDESGRSIAARLGLSEDLVSEIRSGKRHYDLLTKPWATVIGKVHPEDGDR